MSGSTIYQDSFGRARPNLAYQAVNRRLNLTRALTTDLAAYYEERALVEETYVKALQKLSSRLRGSGSSHRSAVEDLGLEQRDEDRQLGAWSSVRSKLEQEITDTAKVHETWRKKVLEEVEGPLRHSLGKADWARWQQGDAQLASTVREYDNTLDKVQKVSLQLFPPRSAGADERRIVGSEQGVQVVQVHLVQASHGPGPALFPRILPYLRSPHLPRSIAVARRGSLRLPQGGARSCRHIL